MHLMIWPQGPVSSPMGLFINSGFFDQFNWVFINSRGLLINSRVVMIDSMGFLINLSEMNTSQDITGPRHIAQVLSWEVYLANL